jgi:transposase
MARQGVRVLGVARAKLPHGMAMPEAPRGFLMRRSQARSRFYEARDADVTIVALEHYRWRSLMPRPKNDLGKSFIALEQHRTVIAVIELSLSRWLVGGIVAGIARDSLKKLEPDPRRLPRLLQSWSDDAAKVGQAIDRVAVAFEAGRDGFWLARWLRARGIEAYVIHPTSVAVSREHRRAKTDRLDVALLKRAFLGWLRGEDKHCSMASLPTLEEEDEKRPNREREDLIGKRTSIINRMKAAFVRLGIRGFNPKLRRAPDRLTSLRTPEGVPIPLNTLAEIEREMAHLQFINTQITQIEDARRERLEQTLRTERHTMVLQLDRVRGIGLDTADHLVHEVFCRDVRDEKAVGRSVGLTGSPDESGARHREKGLARVGNARARHAMIQLAWRFLVHQKESDLAQWYQARVAGGKKRRTMIVALTPKLLIALWRLLTTGEVTQGLVLNAAT